MSDTLTDHWPLLVVGALAVVVLLWWLLLARRRTRVSVDTRDALADGTAPAPRNQALIDAAPVAAPPILPPLVPDGLDGATIALAAAAQGAAAAQAAEGHDDLTRIKGLGPKLAATLHGLGITSFAHIAAWSDSDIDRIDPQLGRFQGRIRRDNWVEQARYLAAGDEAGFEARFGAL